MERESTTYFSALFLDLDKKTMLLSGGWTELPEFLDLRDQREAILTSLLRDLYTDVESEGSDEVVQMHGRWRTDLIQYIAEDLGRPIAFDANMSYEETKLQIVGWGIAWGYLEDQPNSF